MLDGAPGSRGSDETWMMAVAASSGIEAARRAIVLKILVKLDQVLCVRSRPSHQQNQSHPGSNRAAR